MFSSWHRCYWLGGMTLAILLIVAMVMNPWLSTDKQIDRRSMGLDFVAFYTAGTFARDGRATELYNLSALENFQKDLAQRNDLDLKSVAPWWNPPVFAWVFAPLSLLSVKGAYIAWLGINTICLVAAIRLLMNLFPPEISRAYRGLIPLLVCVSMPTVQALGHAQNSPISLLILIGAITLARKNWPVLAGAVVGLLSYKPQIGVAVALILALGMNWRVLIGFAAVGVALLAINVLTLPGTLQQLALHLGENLHQIQFGQIYIWERQITFNGFWRLLVQGREPAERSTAVVMLSLLSQAALASGLFYSWLRSRENVDGHKSESFLIAALAAMPLLLPYFLDYDLLLLAVPAVLYARRHFAQTSALRFTPSLGTPACGERSRTGEGRGGGLSQMRNPKSEIRNSPHPGPPPEYQGRGKDSDLSSREYPMRLGTVMWTALYICLLVNPGVGRLTHVNLAVPLLCMTVGAMIAQLGGKKSATEVRPEVVENFVRLAA